MSDAFANSIPDAAARFRTPSIPDSMLSVDQPASDMYLNALATSVAENFVDAPSAFAFVLIESSCSPVAPEIAATSLIAASNSDPTSTAYLAASFVASPIARTPTVIASPSRFALSTSVNVPAFSVAFPNLSILVAHPSADFEASSIYAAFFFVARFAFSNWVSAVLSFVCQSLTLLPIFR